MPPDLKSAAQRVAEILEYVADVYHCPICDCKGGHPSSCQLVIAITALRDALRDGK